MFPKTVAWTALVLQIFFAVSHAKQQAPRMFAEGYIEGLYGRFFEYTEDGASAPCPRVIDHFNRGFPRALGDSWTVPHDKIVQNGVSCNDRGVLVLDSYNPASKVPDRLKSNPIAVETFNHMKRDSMGFWMGSDARTCGQWVIPNPSFLFFVKEFDRAITTSFRLRLEAGQKYMFVVAPKFTCIYLDVPRRSPNPDVILTPGNGNSPSEGSNGTEAAFYPSSSVDAAENLIDEEPPSQATYDNGTVGTEDSDMSIVDIHYGATPPPTHTQTPRPETIQEVLENEGGGEYDPITAILNDEGLGAEVSETSDPFDVATQPGDSLCFPSTATIELANGGRVRMDELSVGDEVRTGQGYSHVFGFTHKDPSTRQSFLRLTTRSGRSVTLTAGHYLYANNRLIPAKEVRLGDRLRLVTGDGAVERVETVIRSGLYNPQTLQGRIVVDGFVASTYTLAAAPMTAHALLAPIRFLYEFGFRSSTVFKLSNQETIVQAFRLLLSSNTRSMTFWGKSTQAKEIKKNGHCETS